MENWTNIYIIETQVCQKQELYRIKLKYISVNYICFLLSNVLPIK